jgi:protein-S-isoprenylcysteine O-methyltransferase Ste14
MPVPEASVLGILGGLALERVWPWRIGPRATGWVLTAAGVLAVARSLEAAGDTDLDLPERLVTDGPYARSRNPMYVAWHLIHLGVGLGAGSGWSSRPCCWQLC